MPLLLPAVGFLVASFAQSVPLVLTALSLLMISPLLFLGPFLGLNSSFLGGRAAAGAIAMVSTVGSLGGFVGPNVIGVLKEATGLYSPGMVALSARSRPIGSTGVVDGPCDQVPNAGANGRGLNGEAIKLLGCSLASANGTTRVRTWWEAATIGLVNRRLKERSALAKVLGKQKNS